MRAREALGLPGSVVLICRSWRTWPLGATLCVREDPYFHARARCVALGGQCEKLTCPRLGECKSLSSEVKAVGAASSICPSPKKTHKPLARSEPMRVLVLPLLQVVGLCPVKVARKLHHGAFHHCPDGAHPIPLWPSVEGQFVSKREATLTFQKLAALTGTDARITGHACRVTGAQAMAVAGVDIRLIQAFCRWGSRAVGIPICRQQQMSLPK